jgi:hypothetical protein
MTGQETTRTHRKGQGITVKSEEELEQKKTSKDSKESYSAGQEKLG